MKRHVKMPVIELSGTPAEVGEGWGKLTPQTLASALTDQQGYPNSICRYPDPAVPQGLQAESLGSFIMLPHERAMLVAAGNPATHAYLRYEV